MRERMWLLLFFFFFLERVFSMGIAKGAVFFVPVCGIVSKSFPSSTTGIARCWIGVGVRYPSSCNARRIGSIILRSLNNIYGDKSENNRQREHNKTNARRVGIEALRKATSTL